MGGARQQKDFLYQKGHKNVPQHIPRSVTQQDHGPAWLGGFLRAVQAFPLSFPFSVVSPRNRILSLLMIGLRPV